MRLATTFQQIALYSVLGLSAPVWGLEIAHVTHEPARFNPAKNEQATIRFHLNDRAQMRIYIYDDRDLLVRQLTSSSVLDAGDHVIAWDGKDRAGRNVPPEAYRYTLIAKSARGKTVEYDTTDSTGGKPVMVYDLKWNQERKQLVYRLKQSARVNIRIGLKNHGPLMRTLINWVPRLYGKNEEAWDGQDVSQVIDLSRHPNLDINVQAFSLSDNTLLVGPVTDKPQFITTVTGQTEKRKIKYSRKRRMYDHSQQKPEARRDIGIRFRLKPGTFKKRKGLPVVNDIALLELDVADEDRDRILATRCETVFYVDGRFIYENETGFLPMTWRWDPVGSSKGVHYLTANVRGYEGNFGTATLKVYVDPKDE